MAAYFVDSSALVKRYVQETGTAWVRGITRHAESTPIHIARITAVEVASAIARRRKGRAITARQASSILSRFRKHLAGRYIPLELTPDLAADAMRLANTHTLRAYDAVQLAAAVALQAAWAEAGLGGIVFVSADRDLNDAAVAEGLSVDNPNAHP